MRRWTKILTQVFNLEKNIQSPFSKNGILKYVFVISNKQKKTGYLVIWCSVTNKGVWISKIIAPDRPDDSIILKEDIDFTKIPTIDIQEMD